MHVQRLEFPNAAGELLAGQLDRPDDGPVTAYALLAHCFTCSKNTSAVAHISHELTRLGFGVLRFDFTGLGQSQGEFAATTFSSNVADLVAAAAFLERREQAPRLLIGHSLGGAAVIQAAERIPSVTAVATIGAPASPLHVVRHLGDQEQRIATEGEAEVTIGGQRVRLRREFLEDLQRHSLQKALRGLHRALLVLHAPLDEVVGVEQAGAIFQAARHPKSFVSLDRADHLLSRPIDARYAGSVIAAWASRYVAPSDEPHVPTGAVEREAGVQARIGEKGYTTAIQAGRHRLVADEPRADGGEDQGPAPYDYLLGALGACTAMTLRMYADRKGWPLTGAAVRLKHSRIHAADCAECRTREGRLDQIVREISLHGPLNADQRQRLLEISERCPVHRTLRSEIVITSRLTAELEPVG